MPRARCSGCQLWVDTKQPGVAEKVTGYRVNRSRGAAGGTNAISLPKSLGIWLCPACHSVAKGAADLAQGELF
jgi:rubredoxin